jgi:hypothetical protein
MCDDWDENKNNEEIGYANYYNINDEKKILERKLVEESDISLSKELFGTELIGTVDILGTDKLKDKNYTNITLQTKQHHEKSAKNTKKSEIVKKSNKNYDNVFGRSENKDMYDENYGSIADKYN